MSRLRLMAVGDISLQTFNNRHPFEAVKKVLEGADILFGNLETVLSDRGKKKERAVVLQAAPAKASELKDAGFDVLNVANNHIMDLGVSGFRDTLDALRREGLMFIGANDRPERSQVIIEKQGTRLGFLGYSEGGQSLPGEGVWINRIALPDILEDLESIREHSDIVILSLHWGIENVFYPSPQQIALAHRLIDAGAQIILGHHPHVIQGLERYRHGLITYSLGNFQFNPSASRTQTNQSMILDLEISDRGLEDHHVIPAAIDADLVPSAGQPDSNELVCFLDGISRPLNHEALSWSWWYEKIAGEYLLGNLKSFILRIKRYGFGHFLQCVRWLISPFCLKCYLGIARRTLRAAIEKT